MLMRSGGPGPSARGVPCGRHYGMHEQEACFFLPLGVGMRGCSRRLAGAGGDHRVPVIARSTAKETSAGVNLQEEVMNGQ